MLQPTVRRTWAPRGETPICRSWDRHDRLSVIAALTVSPVRRRLGLYWQLASENFRGPAIAAFVRAVHRATGRPLLLVLDRLKAHRTAATLLGAHEGPGPGPYRVAWRPAYAPELDPTEHVWGHTKYDELANYIPENLETLALSVDGALGHSGIDQVLLRGFFRHARLCL